MNNQKTDRRNMAEIGLGRNDRELMNKKGLTIEDVKGVLTDRTLASPESRGDLLKTLVVIVFGILLVASGIFIAVTLSYTVVGLFAGAAMAIIGVALPFYAFRGGSGTEK